MILIISGIILWILQIISIIGRSDLHGFIMSIRWSMGFTYGMGYWLGSNWAGILGTLLIIAGIIVRIRKNRQSENYYTGSSGGDVTDKISALAKYASNTEASDSSNKWICSNCNEKNSSTTMSCLSCGKYK